MMDIFANTLNTLSVNPTKWSNRLKQFIGELPKNCLSLFDHFVGLALKELTIFSKKSPLQTFERVQNTTVYMTGSVS